MPRVTSLNGGIIGADNTPSPTKKITTFTSNGCFNRTVPTAQVVVVAGGGGGSYGGGGAGGVYVTGTCHPLPCSAVPVTVGAGGSESTDNGCLGGHGNNSVFATASSPITAKKGMGGGGQVGEGGAVSCLHDPGHAFGSGSGSGLAPDYNGGRGSHPGSYGGCSPIYQGSPGGRVGNRSGGGGGACDIGQGMGNPGTEGGSNGGMGRDLTPIGVPTCLGDCGFFGGGGQAGSQGDPSNPGAIMRAFPDKSSFLGKKQRGGGGAGIQGNPTILTVCCYKSSTNVAGTANTGGGGGGARYPGSAPFPVDKKGGAGGSGVVIVLECVAGSSAKSGIYSMAEQYVHAKRSSW